MKVILTNPENLVGQALAAKFALSIGRPEVGNVDLIQSGNMLFGIKWNKASLTIYDQGEAREEFVHVPYDINDDFNW